MRCNNYTIPMRMKLYTLLCISFFLLFTACNQDDDPVPPEKVSRTVLVYIMADNSLSNYASLDIDDGRNGCRGCFRQQSFSLCRR